MKLKNMIICCCKRDYVFPVKSLSVGKYTRKTVGSKQFLNVLSLTKHSKESLNLEDMSYGRLSSALPLVSRNTVLPFFEKTFWTEQHSPTKAFLQEARV